MDLILWRHAEAFDSLPDMTRKLTPKGHRQAVAVAEWLRERMQKQTRLLVSPATRAQETARALSETFETVAAIAPGCATAAVLGAAGWPDARTAALIVGHQPALGEVAALLLAGESMDFSVKKGGVWWLTHRVRGESAQVVVRAVVNPDLI